MSAMKFSDIVQQFDGSSDFAEWVQKVELVAKLQKVGNLAAFVPLFLTGGAFAVYQGLDEVTRSDYGRLKSALLAAFSLNAFSAYEQLTTRSLRSGESVDVYLAELSKLQSLIGDRLLVCAFVAGLPSEAKRQLIAACSLSELRLQDVTEKARRLVTSQASCCASQVSGVENRRVAPSAGERRRPICFECGKEGHLRRDCPQKATAGGKIRQRSGENPKNE
jgi:hypothetical protein